MQKVYSLLRNNKQTGPYSLEEIINMGLKPFDLVWIEGKSAGWRYPTEIDALKKYVSGLPEDPIQQGKESISFTDRNISFQSGIQTEEVIPIRATVKYYASHIFVSLPAGRNLQSKQVEDAKSTIPERKAEDLHQKDDTLIKELPKETIEPEVKYARSMNEIEQDYTKWVFKQKRKKSYLFSNKSLSVAILVTIIIAGGYLAFSNLFSSQKQSQVLSVKNGMQALASSSKPEEKALPAINIPNKNDTKTDQIPAYVTHKTSYASNIYRIPKKHNLKVQKGQKKIIISTYPKVEPVKQNLPNRNMGNSVSVVPNPQKVASKENTIRKKKKIGDFLNNVFGKIEKKPVSIPQQLPAERNASKRDEASDQTQDIIPQPDLIEIAGNERSDSWQLGIFNLKVTLLNHNSVPVKKANVDVMYFDENDRLLEKRTLYFSNIPARGSITLKAPDQKWADHSDYSLVSLK